MRLMQQHCLHVPAQLLRYTVIHTCVESHVAENRQDHSILRVVQQKQIEPGPPQPVRHAAFSALDQLQAETSLHVWVPVQPGR